jgi:hypothetical protein
LRFECRSPGQGSRGEFIERGGLPCGGAKVGAIHQGQQFAGLDLGANRAPLGQSFHNRVNVAAGEAGVAGAAQAAVKLGAVQPRRLGEVLLRGPSSLIRAGEAIERLHSLTKGSQIVHRRAYLSATAADLVTDIIAQSAP